MDFAAEPVIDAIAPPPRAAGRAAVPDADDAASFEAHLDTAVNETPKPAPEKSADRAQDVEVTSTETDSPTTVNAAIAPVIAPPLVVQIAASATTGNAAMLDAVQHGAPSDTPVQAPTPAATPQAGGTAQNPPGEANQGDAGARAKAAQSDGKVAPVATAPTQAGQAPATSPSINADAALAATQSEANSATTAAAQTMMAAALPPALSPQQQPAQTRAQAKTIEAPDAKGIAASGDAEAAARTPQRAKLQNGKADATPAFKDAIGAQSANAPAISASADATQQLSASAATTTTAAQASTHVQHAAADTSAQRAAPAAAQVSREIIRRFDGGNTSFEIRLDPPELGRVEVRLEVSRDHRVTAVIAADSPQALTELARHARDLEAQLQSAGLELGDNGLSFNLRQGDQGGENERADARAASSGADDVSTETQTTQGARPIGFERWRGVRVDMMV